MIVGFTGTQRGMTANQWSTLFHLLCARGPGEFHEGDCIGSDGQAAWLARHVGFRVVGHPPTIDAKRAFFPADEWRPAAPYLVRNNKIVHAAQEMIATPGEFVEQLRSGTWATIRYARKMRRRLHVIYPDGMVTI